jgi:hypothetical protein
LGLAEWHIYLRVKATKESAMTSSNPLRWGGLAALIGGVLYALTGIMSLFAPQEEVFDSFTDYFIEVLFVLALVGTLMAIAGLHVLQRERYGRLGAASSLTAFIGHALLLVAAAATTLAGREALDMVFFLGSLAALVGLVLLGATTLRARVLPWWCGVVLIVGLPLSVVLDVTARGSGGILLGVVWALVGYALLAMGGASNQQPARAS